MNANEWEQRSVTAAAIGANRGVSRSACGAPAQPTGGRSAPGAERLQSGLPGGRGTNGVEGSEVQLMEPRSTWSSLPAGLCQEDHFPTQIVLLHFLSSVKATGNPVLKLAFPLLPTSLQAPAPSLLSHHFPGKPQPAELASPAPHFSLALGPLLPPPASQVQ